MSDPIRPTDDSPEGGRYVDANGFWINGDGKYTDARGNVVEKPVKANQPKPNSNPAPQKPAPTAERTPFAAQPTKRPDEE